MASAAPFDAIVVGGGLVGTAVAAALAGGGCAVALVEHAPAAPLTDQWDARIYAISPGSRAFLERIGAWARLDPARLQAVERMAVFGDMPGARLEFSAYEAGVARLATMLESGRLQTALAAVARDCGVETFSPVKCTALEAGAADIVVTLEDGRRLRGRLVVGADGALSWVRSAAGLDAQVKDYGQLGVVANFAAERPHGGTAYQWFRKDGVLAYLPLPGNRLSIVWSTPEPHAAGLLGLAPDALAQRVAAAGGNVLGRLEPLGAAQGYPLRRLTASAMIAPRVALVGDAAHVVHPLAGQGVNLGFGDAAALAGALAGARGGDCGTRARLRRYERARAEAILLMRSVTDGLVELFGIDNPALARVRGLGLSLTHRIPVLKSLLVRHAVG